MNAVERLLNGKSTEKVSKFIGECGHEVVDHYSKLGFDSYCVAGYDEIEEEGAVPEVKWFCSTCYDYKRLSKVVYEWDESAD